MDKFKEKYFSIIIFSFILILIYLISNNSFALEYEEDYTMFYKDDEEYLSIVLKKYIESIDDEIISSSSFGYSDILSENYDFITKFSIMYILKNKEKYIDDIVVKDKYSYVNIDALYDVSKKFFNKDYFEIIGDDVSILNNYVTLSNYDDIVVDDEIKSISLISKDDKYISFNVVYNMFDKFKYTFEINHNILYLYNVEVVYE